MIGFDVAGDERNFHLDSFQSPMVKGIKRAQELGVPVTIHAGGNSQFYYVCSTGTVRLFLHQKEKLPYPHVALQNSALKLDRSRT